MRRLIGRVLVKETNAGVPNLVVAAYDSAEDFSIERGGQPNKALGRRIASVLSDQAGAFSFTCEELHFNGNEARPDLLLVVFAPEDVQSPEKPFPLPPEQRTLYISTTPRADAGAEEAFIIRLLQAQLDRFSIPSATFPGKNDDNVNRMHRAVEETLALRDGLKERLGPRLRREQQRVDKIRKTAVEKVKSFSGIPQHLRTNDLRDNRFRIMGRGELATKLKSTQDEAILDGLKRLKKQKPTLRLTLGMNELRSLGLTYKNGKITGKVDPKKLESKTKSLLKGFDLVRRVGLNNPSPDELRRKYLTEESPTPAEAQPSNGRKNRSTKKRSRKRG